MNLSETSLQSNGMGTSSMFGRTLRSVAAVFAGVLAVIIFSIGTDTVLHLTSVYPAWDQPMSDPQFTFALAYRSIYAVAGSYLAARLAPMRPMQHAIALGLVGFVLALIGTIATWNAGPAFARKWYPIALILTAIPCAWIGGKLQAVKTSK